MSPIRVINAVALTVLVAAGCTDESTTSLAPTEMAIPTDLAFRFPEVTRETFVPSVTEEVDPPAAPASVLTEGSDPVDETDPEAEPDMTTVSQITSASTKVGFTDTYAYSTGRHVYTGNLGKVSTEAVVYSEGQVIGRQPAERQNYFPFLLDILDAQKEIWAEAYVFTDQDCGLTVDGSSKHWAWWQWFLGATTPKWGETFTTSQAFPPVSQDECTDDPGNEWTGGESADDSSGSGSACWYWFSYDLDTGEILDSQFLYCEGIGG